jgi:ribonuclease P protein subunit RPR2
MAKAKKENAKNSQSHIRARLDYLHHAAVYFQGKPIAREARSEKRDLDASQLGLSGPVQSRKAAENLHADQEKNHDLGNLSRVCVSHLRAVAMKTQIRLPVKLKRSMCKSCDTLLTPGVTCSQGISNASRGCRKPWADVLVVRCFVCGTEKRFPQTDKRAKKLDERRKEKSNLPSDEHNENAQLIDRMVLQQSLDRCDENTPISNVVDDPAM